VGVNRADAGRVDEHEPGSEKRRLALHFDPGYLASIGRVPRLRNEISEVLPTAKRPSSSVEVDNRYPGRTVGDLRRDGSDGNNACRQ
jgi:hypothetical protein